MATTIRLRTSSRWQHRLAAVAAFHCGISAWTVANACESDSECKGNRVCDAGRCVTPGDTTKPSPNKGQKAHVEDESSSADSPSEASDSDAPPQKHKKKAKKHKPAAESSSTDPPVRDEVEETTPKGKQNTSGLAAGAGAGFQTAGFGFWAGYYAAVGENVFLTPYLGFGWLPIDGDSVSGPALGGMFVAGSRHRFLMDLGWGLAGGVRPASTTTYKPSVQGSYGGTLALGYEFMSVGGFFFRAEFGITQITSENWSDASRTQPTLQLALGGKLM